MKCVLIESVSTLPVQESEPGRYKIRLIGADILGSSGYYSRAVIERDGAKAFPRLTKIYADHPTVTEANELPERSVKNIAGKFVTDPWMEEDGLYTMVQFGREYLGMVEDFHDVLGMSIYAEGRRETRMIEGEEVPEVVELFPSPFNSCDLVTVPGANGAVIAAFAESARQTSAPAVEDKNKEGNSNMEIEELAAKVEALTESMATVADAVGKLVEAQTPALKEEEPVAASAAEISDAVEKAVEAELPKEFRTELAEALAHDKEFDVDAFIESKVKFIEGLRESRTNDEPPVKEHGSITESAAKFVPSGWKL